MQPLRTSLPELMLTTPLRRRLVWVVGGRLVGLACLLGLAAWVGLTRTGFDDSFSVRVALIVLALGFGVTGLYLLVLRRGRHLVGFANVQVVVDQVLWTVLVYLTGGVTSGAVALYGATCVVGAILTGARGASLAALAAVVGYLGLALALVSGELPPPPDQNAAVYLVTPAALAYHVTVTLLALLGVAGLSGYLARRLERAGGLVRAAEDRAHQAERLAAFGGLAAGLAHEVRNPLSSIAVSTRMLRAAPGLSAEDQELCDIIAREAGRLNDLVADMLDLARPNAPRLGAVDLAGVVKEVIALATSSGRARGEVRLTYRGPDSCVVSADGAQLRQLVWNLLRNAVQASAAGAEVRLIVGEVDGVAQLRVEDEGPGIPEEARARLFDAFFTTRSQGTGIGLAVVKRIADEHGFTLSVESAPGRGTSFRVDFTPAVSPRRRGLA